MHKYKKKEIPEFFNYYADTEGNIWSDKPRGRQAQLGKKFGFLRKLIPKKAGRGYRIVCLSKEGCYYYKYIHRLVLETFIGICPKGMECCHNNGIKTDNRLENLRWDTPANNVRDNKKFDVYKLTIEGRKRVTEFHKGKIVSQEIKNKTSGINNYQAKLNEQQVRIIRAFKQLKNIPTYGEIGEIFNVSAASVSNVINNNTYKNAE